MLGGKGAKCRAAAAPSFASATVARSASFSRASSNMIRKTSSTSWMRKCRSKSDQRRNGASVCPGRPAPQRLHCAAASLLVEAASPRGERWPRGEPGLRPLLRFRDEGGEARPGVLPIARLARELLGENDDD